MSDYLLMLRSAPDLEDGFATGYCDTWFDVVCPFCNTLTLVSRWEPDGSMCDCDACPGSFFFYAGHFADRRKVDPG